MKSAPAALTPSQTPKNSRPASMENVWGKPRGEEGDLDLLGLGMFFWKCFMVLSMVVSKVFCGFIFWGE